MFASAPTPLSPMKLLERLVAVGDRSCGSPGGAAAAEELERAFRALGLEVREEPFRFLRAATRSSALVHAGRALHHLPLAYAASGQVRAHAVDAGTATDDLVGDEAVKGAIALVRRDLLRHRQAQYRTCVEAGAAAMVLVSDAPGDAPQEGSIREAWEGPGELPCVAVGARTGALLLEAAAAGRLDLELAVEVDYLPATGRNLVARVDGPGLHRGIECGAHYDAWGPGAVDNASGCAALLACARDLLRHRPVSPVDLVLFDGEEIGLLGAWHRVRHRRPGPGVLLDLEMPSSREATLKGLGIGSALACGKAAEESGLSALYDLSGPMAQVPEMLGGTIPADVWPYYLAGLGSLCTVCDTPHYHTAGDVPETVDPDLLLRVGEASARALALLAAASPEHLVGRDAPHGMILAAEDARGLSVEARFAWEDGKPIEDVKPGEALAFADDFRLVARVPVQALGGGRYRADLPAEAARLRPLDLTVHLTSGSESAEAHLRLEPAGGRRE